MIHMLITSLTKSFSQKNENVRSPTHKYITNEECA